MTDDDYFSLAESADESADGVLEWGKPVVLHSTYSGSSSSPSIVPGLIFLVITPPGADMPSSDVADKSGQEIAGSSVGSLCGFTAGTLAQASVELLLIHHNTSLMSGILHQDMLDQLGQLPMADIAAFGAHSAQRSFLKQSDRKVMVLLGGSLSYAYPNRNLRYCSVTQYAEDDGRRRRLLATRNVQAASSMDLYSSAGRSSTKLHML